MDEVLIQEVFKRAEDHQVFKAGQAIFRQGEAGHLMFILVEGIVEVVVGENVVGAFEPIEVFGEMAVIDAGPRSATVLAKTDCKLVALNQSRFLYLIQQKPQLAIHIMRMLVDRIRWMNTTSAPPEEASAEQPPAGAPAAEAPTEQPAETLAAPPAEPESPPGDTPQSSG